MIQQNMDWKYIVKYIISLHYPILRIPAYTKTWAVPTLDHDMYTRGP
jgi:hypothetical protein